MNKNTYKKELKDYEIIQHKINNENNCNDIHMWYITKCQFGYEKL